MRNTPQIFLGLTLGLGLAIGSLGCKSESSSTGSSADSKPKQPLAGKWRGKVEIASDKKDDPAAKMAEQMAGMFGDFILDIKDDDTFTLAVLGMPTEGKVSIQGNQITFTPTHVMGKTVAEFNKEQEAKGGSKGGDPMKGTISADLSTITVKDEKQPGNLLVFKRDTTKPREIGPATVTRDEEPFVGVYDAVLNEKRLKTEDKAMADALVSRTKLELFRDNTFTMNMMMEVEGKWKLDKGQVVLTPTKINGMDEKPDSGNKPISLKPNGKTLEPLPTDGNAPPFDFVRKG